MRSEYLFSRPPPARLWLENGYIPAGQLFPKATFPQVPKTVLFYLSRPKDDKHKSWVLYHLLLNILSFSHVVNFSFIILYCVPEDLICFLPGSWYTQSIKNRILPSVRYSRLLVRKKQRRLRKSDPDEIRGSFYLSNLQVSISQIYK